MKTSHSTRFATLLVTALTAVLTSTVCFGRILTPVTVLKCTTKKSQDENGQGKKGKRIDFKMSIYQKDVEGSDATQNLRTVFKGNFSGHKIHAQGLTSKTGYTDDHKAVFETTFPGATNDMKAVKIRFASGAVPLAAVLDAVFIVPVLGTIPVEIPLGCTRKPSFRF